VNGFRCKRAGGPGVQRPAADPPFSCPAIALVIKDGVEIPLRFPHRRDDVVPLPCTTLIWPEHTPLPSMTMPCPRSPLRCNFHLRVRARKPSGLAGWRNRVWRVRRRDAWA
jgi:hypothetical protein